MVLTVVSKESIWVVKFSLVASSDISGKARLIDAFLNFPVVGGSVNLEIDKRISFSNESLIIEKKSGAD
jgi:hypothetical protein